MSGDSTNLRQEFTTELESILESDEAYGSNVQVLTYSLKEDVISGKFKDSWNNRVYEFIVDTNGISYKPAIKLDSFSADEMPARFDSYSEGYASLFVDTRFDGKLTGKRTKKPKCGNSAYGCGYSCIGLLKTCQILSSENKGGAANRGRAIGKERLSKLIALSTKLAASGDNKKFAAINAVGARITSARNKYQGEGRDKMAQRQVSSKEKAQSKNEPKTQEKQSTNPKSDPTTNPKTHSIKTQKEFEDTMLHVIDKVNKEGKHNGLVPIYELRKAVGELVPRDKFKEFMMSMQNDSENIMIMGGEMPGITPEKASNSLTAPSGNLRYYVKLTSAGEEKSKSLSSSQQAKADKLLKDRPELDPLGTARKYATGPKITSQKEFETTLTNVYKALNDEFNHNDLVPISRVREVLKDRAPKDDFDRMIKEVQGNKYTLVGHGSNVPDELRKGGITTMSGAERHYIKKDS